MYEPHPNLYPPPDGAVLWRYMDFTKFVSLLERKALFFCRPDRLGDLFEGSLSPVTPPVVPQNLKAGPDAHLGAGPDAPAGVVILDTEAVERSGKRGWRVVPAAVAKAIRAAREKGR